MVKLEVGSKVRHRACDPHDIGTVVEIKTYDRYMVKWEDYSSCDHIDDLIPVYSSCKAAQVDVQREEYGPIRTRREVVPGTYGRVTVENGSPFACIVGMKPAALNADELREAAHLFNQLAEVLDDNRA